jgi:hypothetical protein
LFDLTAMPKANDLQKDYTEREQSIDEEAVALEAIFSNDFARPNTNTLNIRFPTGLYRFSMLIYSNRYFCWGKRRIYSGNIVSRLCTVST